jgi:DNA-binding transcriptional ArsR family regulator
MLGLAPSTVSRHMSLLQQGGFVEARKAGRWRYYRLAGRKADPVVRKAVSWVCSALDDDAAIVADRKRLK